MMLANISAPRWNYICRFQIWPYFRGELRDFEKMYNPMTISELKRYLFTSKLYFGVEVLSLYALTESPLGQHRKKTWFSGKQPPPPAFLFVWSCQLIQCLGLLCLRQCFFVSNDAMISSLNPDLPWLEYLNSLLADYDVQVKTKTALNVVVCLLSIALLKSFRSYLVVFKLVVLL